MHDLISGFFSSLSSRLLLLILLSTALPGCANQVRVPSENFNTRVSLLVIHHTTENFAESLETLTKKSGYPVSSHYLIPEPDDPTYDQRKLRIYELVPETHRAWHAGDSYWGGRTSLNDQSIGIELVNRTHCHRSAVDTGDGIVEAAEAPGPGTIDESTAIAGAAPASICFYPDFAESQIDLLVDLLEDVLKRHPSIKPTQIVGHSDIAPDRKIDPGPRFPWQRLYRHGFGAWYDDDTVIRYWERFRLQPLPLRNVQRALGVYGYRIEANGKFDVQTRDVLRAFQMHFRPAQSYGSMTTETVATLFALIEKYYPDQLDELLRVDVAVEKPWVPPSGSAGGRAGRTPFIYRVGNRTFRPDRHRKSHRAGDIEEYPLVPEIQIGQVVGEVTEVVSQPDFQVLPNLPGNAEQGAVASFIEIGHVEHPPLDEQVPDFPESPIGPQHVQARIVREELRVLPVEAHLANAIRVLATDR